jgi:hypothetical protein
MKTGTRLAPLGAMTAIGSNWSDVTALASDIRASSFGTGNGYAGLSKPKTSHAAQKRLSKQRKAIRARSPK